MLWSKYHDSQRALVVTTGNLLDFSFFILKPQWFETSLVSRHIPKLNTVFVVFYLNVYVYNLAVYVVNYLKNIILVSCKNLLVNLIVIRPRIEGGWMTY